ncbi:5'-methylthioadenosine/S-adenosylhomocysteine nucleosidase family protein [Serratia sp. MMO-24]
MKYCVRLEWLVITKLPYSNIYNSGDNKILFNPKSGRNFLRGIGGNICSQYSPIVLEPTALFHSTLSTFREQYEFTGKRFPYVSSTLLPGISARVNINLHLFDNVLCVKVSINDTEIDVDKNFSFKNIQDLNKNNNIAKLIKKIIAMILDGNRNAVPIGTLPKIYPAIRIVPQEKEHHNWKLEMVELVTRHEKLLNSVADLVLEKNNAHQVDQSLILIDKQGIVSYVPYAAPETASGNLQRYKNSVSILELAAILKAQIESYQVLGERESQLINNPDEAIPDSVSSQKVWTLVNKELKLAATLQRNNKKMNNSPIKRKILLVTVTGIESKAIINNVFQITQKKYTSFTIKDTSYQALGIIGQSECFLCMSEMGSSGVGGSHTSVDKAIQNLNPDAVIMVGIAFGVDENSQSVGDILVSQQLQLYDLQRINADSSITLRGDKPHASSKIIGWVRNAMLSWPDSNAKVDVGLILSGEKLVDNFNYRDELKRLVPTALGGEMEGTGVYSACLNEKKDWILIKAICDWADGNKSENKKSQQNLAANNAAEFVVHLLNSLES